MAKQKREYTEIDDIKEDLNSLRTNVVELTKHIRENGNAQTQRITDMTKDQIGLLRKSGKAQMKRVEKRVKDKPAQSMAYAFAAGLFLSALLRSRG